jgi:hypothetical protein
MRTSLTILLAFILTLPCISCAADNPRPTAAPANNTAGDPTVNPIDPTVAKKLEGEWHNQLKSTLIIKSVDPQTGAITGSYRSPSGTTGNPFPLVGWVNVVEPAEKKDNVVIVSFSVRWGTYGSITAWNGYFRDNKIVGQWLLTRSNSDFPWDHILTGQDQFEPGKK